MKDPVFDEKIDSSIKKGRLVLKDILKRDSEVRKITQIFDMYLAGQINNLTFKNFDNALKIALGEDLTKLLMLPMQEVKPASLQKYEKLGFEKKELEFISKLCVLYGSKVREAWGAYKMPKHWLHAQSELYFDAVANLGLNTTLFLGDGSVVNFKSNVDSCFDLIIHLLKNVDRFVEGGTGPENKFKEIESYLSSLRKKLNKNEKSSMCLAKSG